jgi:hypothetical protein
MPVNFPVKIDEEEDDSTAPYNELEAFKSMCDALRWRHVRKRVPICFKKSLHNRYMLANLIYLGYTIALLVLDFHPDFNTKTSETSPIEISTQATPILDQPVVINEYVNRIYIGKSLISFFC